MRNRAPCRVGADPSRPISIANPCKCIAELAALRQAKAAEQMAKIERKTVVDKQNEAADKTIAALGQLASVVDGIASRQAPAPRAKKDE
jgi:hypothetical protein